LLSCKERDRKRNAAFRLCSRSRYSASWNLFGGDLGVVVAQRAAGRYGPAAAHKREAFDKTSQSNRPGDFVQQRKSNARLQFRAIITSWRLALLRGADVLLSMRVRILYPHK
jgi:hypothetical protein